MANDSTILGKAPNLTQLGPYTIESKLGQGGMGIVYRAMDKNLGRLVAIKVLHPHLLTHENLKQRFRREARMHAKLMHPNIVTLLSLYEDDKHMALVMELVKGDNLKTYLRKNRGLPIKKKLYIAIEILKGLEAAHALGMVHRDLKPANVIISEKGEVKLLDFGLAKPEEGEEDLTQSGATVGSFRYMAPEQIMNTPIDARTDLYAFGILLFYMLLGKLPFDATGSGGEFEIMEKQVREPAPKPHELDASIPVPLSNLILKLLEKNKAQRPEHASIVRQDIKNILDQLQFLATPKAREQQPATPVETPATSSLLSNHQVAKQWVDYGRFRWQALLRKLIPHIQQPHADLSMIALVFIMLGSGVISVLSMAEKTVAQTQIAANMTPLKKPVLEHVTSQTLQKTEHKATTPTERTESKRESTKVEPAINTSTKHEKSTASKAANSKVEVSKQAQAQPKQKPKAKAQVKTAVKKRIPRSIAYRVPHRVERKDKSKVDTKTPHEFRGGSHLFYPELAEKGWLSSFKHGYSAILFDQPVSLSKIIVHKASVGDLDFKHGFIQVEIKPEGKRKWKKIFVQKNKDIDKALTISGFKDKYPSLDGVRIKFKTQDPITIGPIDLLK